jgi:hypothetical protein
MTLALVATLADLKTTAAQFAQRHQNKQRMDGVECHIKVAKSRLACKSH